MPRKIAVGGARSKDYFDRHGDLKRIRRLKYWPLDRLLVDKFKFSDNDAREFSEFLCPLLDFAPENRPTAQQCLQHPWLNIRNSTKNEVKSESSLQKVDVGMSNLKIKVGKWRSDLKVLLLQYHFYAPPSTCMCIDCDLFLLFCFCFNFNEFLIRFDFLI